MEGTNIKEFANTIESERRYWLVRTMGGDYYKEFVQEDFIAIGYNEITLNDLKQLPSLEHTAKNTLSEIFDNRLGIKKEKSSYIISQILRFYREIKVGDVVIVPGRNSHFASFGIVVSDMYEDVKNLHKADSCQFTKRKKIDWRIHQNKFRLNPNLQLMFNTRHIISDVDGYASYIDSLMNDFYIKDDEAHLVLRIKTENEISTEQFFAFYQVFNIVDKFCKEQNIDETTKDIILKIQMESPGDVRLSSKSILIISLVGLTILAICGGGLTFKVEKIGLDFDLSTKGGINLYNEYLDREVDRDLKTSIARQFDSLDIKKPEDMEVAIKLLIEQNSIRNNY